MTCPKLFIPSPCLARRLFAALSALLGLGATIALSPGGARANVIIDWNIATLKTTASAAFNPPLETRNVAIVHAAIFDAVNSIEHEFHPYLIKARAADSASPEAAAVAAAHFALTQLYPAQKATLDAAYAVSLAAIPDGRAKTAGIFVGESVAAQILSARASDGAEAALSTPYAPTAAPGVWIPTPPAFLPALAPGWGSVVPFLLRTSSQFRADSPPSLTSRQYTRDFDEIKEIGSATSLTRTQEETDLARLWISTAAQNWNPIARQVVIARKLNLAQTARVLALLNLAGADAFIASWAAKFTYNQWRPVTAIRAADVDGNPSTVVDASWTPLLITPPFPDYVAGHTTYAGAAATVLEHLFGNCPDVVMALTSPSAPGVVRTYTNFEAIADDVVEARILGGIHWRTSSVVGKRVGDRIGNFAVHQILTPQKRDAGDGTP